MKIGIVGAHGFLGINLIKIFIENKDQIEKISFRKVQNKKLITVIKYNLNKINSCDVLINCAAVKNPKNKYDLFINTKLPKLLQNHINKNKIKCKFIHISTLNVLFKFLDDDYTKQKKIAEDKLNKDHVLIIRPSLIWSSFGRGESLIFRKYLEIPSPFYFMINPGNIYRPIDPLSLAKFIMISTRKIRLNSELNIVGDKVVSFYDLFQNLGIQMKKKIIPIKPFFLIWIKWVSKKKYGSLKTLSQQLQNYDRTGDKLILKNKIFLKYNLKENK